MSDNENDPITPTHGKMDDKQHMGFILRIFMHMVECTPGKAMEFDLEDVMRTTSGRQMQVALRPGKFSVRTIPDIMVATKEELAKHGKN